jgi:hypothetical protein
MTQHTVAIVFNKAWGKPLNCDDPADMSRFRELASKPGSIVSYGVNPAWRVQQTFLCYMMPEQKLEAWQVGSAKQ